MKYRRLGRNGPQVSAISMGRGAAAVKLDTSSKILYAFKKFFL